MPENLTLMSLPPWSPELNPAENLWQFLRQTFLSNRVFETVEDILDAPATPGTPSSTPPDGSCPSGSATGPAQVSVKGGWYKPCYRCLREEKEGLQKKKAPRSRSEPRLLGDLITGSRKHRTAE
jgi:hypothetical protein